MAINYRSGAKTDPCVKAWPKVKTTFWRSEILSRYLAFRYFEEFSKTSVSDKKWKCLSTECHSCVEFEFEPLHTPFPQSRECAKKMKTTRENASHGKGYCYAKINLSRKRLKIAPIWFLYDDQHQKLIPRISRFFPITISFLIQKRNSYEE